MPNLKDFERRLGGLVEGLFSKTFRSGLQPIEIAKRVVRDMESGRQVGINEVGVVRTSVHSGDDYQIAGIDPATFDATGYPCVIGSEGTVGLAGDY